MKSPMTFNSIPYEICRATTIEEFIASNFGIFKGKKKLKFSDSSSFNVYDSKQNILGFHLSLWEDFTNQTNQLTDKPTTFICYFSDEGLTQHIN